MQPFQGFSRHQGDPGAGFGTPQGSTHSSSEHPSDPRTSPHSRQESPQPDSTELLSPRQVELLTDIMKKDVHIKTKTTDYRTCVKVQAVMNAFLTAYSNLCKRLSGVIEHPYETLPVIRGSTILSLIEETAHHSDIDVFYKYPIGPPLRYTPSYHGQTNDFQSFCYMLGLEALQILDPDHLNYYQIVNINGELHCKRSDMRNPGSLVLKANSVFMKFSPFYPKSGCLFSLGDVNEGNRKTSTEIDITFLFGERSVSPLQVISPSSPSPIESPREGSSPSTMELPDSRETFLHDGLDLRVPLNDLAKSHLYSPYSVPLVKLYLSERRLEIVDPMMFRGYPRLFLWVTRGFIPPKAQQYFSHESAEDKIIRMLSQIESSSPTTEHPALSYFNRLVQEKSKSPHFAYHFFLNAYQIAIMIKETLDSKNEKSTLDSGKIDQLKEFLHLLDYEFIHSSWQKLFPKYVQDLSKFKNPVKLSALVSQLKAHLGLYRDTPTENSIRDSLGTKVRVVGRRDNRHGYFITKVISFEQVLQSISSLKSKTSVEETASLPDKAESIFDEIMSFILRPLSMIHCEDRNKLLLLYCIRMLQQESLTEEEVESFIPLINPFLSLWIPHEEALEAYGLHAKWKNFVTKNQERLFSPNEQILVNPLIEDSLSRYNPSLLPSLTYFLDRVHKKEAIDPDVQVHWEHKGMFSYLGNYILFFAKSTLTQHILKYLAVILSHTKDLFPDLCKTLLEEIILREKDSDSLDAKDKEVINYLVIQMVYAHNYTFLIQNEGSLKAISSHDILSDFVKTPTFFDQASHKERLAIMSHCLETKNQRLLSVIFENYPDLATQILKQWMEAHLKGHDSIYHFLSSLDLIAKNLLENPDWVPLLFNQNRPLALQLASHLILSRPPSEVSLFLKELKVHSPDIGPIILASLSADKQHLFLSPELIPIWLEMIPSGLALMGETLLVPLLKLFENPLLSKDPSPLLLSTLVSILVKFTDSNTYDAALTKEILFIYLPHLSRSTPSGYMQLLENLNLDFSDKSAQIQSIWAHEIHKFVPKRISLDSYISWAITQPISEKIVLQISEKLTSKKISPQQFTNLYTYFQERPDLLKRLIILGETSQLDSSLLAPIYKKLIPSLGTLESHLRSLNRLLHQNYERDLISLQITHLKKPDSLSPAERALLVDCFDKINRCDTSIKQELFEQMLKQGFFGLDPLLAPLLISKIAEDWVLSRIYELVTLIEAKDHSIAKALLEKPLYVQGSHPIIFMNELNRFEISPSFCEFLSSLIQKTGKGFPSHSEMFPRIEKQIKRIQAHYSTEGRPISVTALYSHYFNTFIGQILSANPDDISLVFECASGKDLLKFLPNLIPHLLLLSHPFINLYLHMIHKDTTQPVKSDQELLHKMMQRYIELSIEKESFELLSIYSKVNPDDPELLTLYGKVFHKAATNRNEDLLVLIVKVLDTRFNAPSLQKKKKALKATFETFVSKTAPCDVVVTLEFTKMFREALELDPSSIALTLMGILARQPAEKRELDTVIHLIYNIFIENKYTFAPSQTEMIQAHFAAFFKHLSPNDFQRILHHLSRTMILPYSSPCIKFFFQTKGDLLVRYMFNEAPIQDTFPLIKLGYHYLIQEQALNPAHVTDMVAVIQAKIFDWTTTTPKTPDLLSLMVISLNLYSGLIPHVPPHDKPTMDQFLKSCMAHVTEKNFAFNPDRFWIFSFLNIITSTQELGQINPLISALRDYFIGLGESESLEKELMFTFILNNIMVLLLNPFAILFMDIENIVSLLQQVPLPFLTKNPQNIDIFIKIFKMLANNFQRSKTSHSGAESLPRSLPTDGLKFLVMLISVMTTPTTSIKSINELIRIIGVISADGVLKKTNEAFIRQIYQICLLSVKRVLSHPDLEKEINESALAIKIKGLPSAHIPILALVDCFIHRLTLITNNLKTSCANLATPIPPLDMSEVTDLQHKLLFLIDNQLIKGGQRVPSTYMIPFRTIPYNYITFVAEFLMSPLLAVSPTKLDEQLQMTRLIMGLAQVIRGHLEQIQDSSDHIAIERKASPYFREINELQNVLRESMFRLLENMITNALRPPHVHFIEEIIDITEVSVLVLDHEQTRILCTLAKDKILVEESKKTKPNSEIVAKVMSLIGYLRKHPDFVAKAEELKDQAVSIVPTNLLLRILARFGLEWPWRK